MAEEDPRTKGLGEDVKGKAKQVAGRVAGDETLEREGSAQQGKADAEREAAAKEKEAERARAEAQLHDADQRRNQP